MSIGLGVFLMALGLILALGVRDRLSDFDLGTIGWVLTGVGALAIVVSVMVTSMRTRGRRTEYVDRPRTTEYVERRDVATTSTRSDPAGSAPHSHSSTSPAASRQTAAPVPSSGRAPAALQVVPQRVVDQRRIRAESFGRDRRGHVRRRRRRQPAQRRGSPPAEPATSTGSCATTVSQFCTGRGAAPMPYRTDVAPIRASCSQVSTSGSPPGRRRGVTVSAAVRAAARRHQPGDAAQQQHRADDQQHHEAQQRRPVPAHHGDDSNT